MTQSEYLHAIQSFSPVLDSIHNDQDTETMPEIPVSHYKSLSLPMKTRKSPKLTLVLDLDETLIHTSISPIENPDQMLSLQFDNEYAQGYVKYRPFLFQFLKRAAQEFEVVLFTASNQAYADQILSRIDPQRELIRYRYYRQDCTLVKGMYVKDLSILGRDLSQVVIADNSISAIACQLTNGVPISTWTYDENDLSLIHI